MGARFASGLLAAFPHHRLGHDLVGSDAHFGTYSLTGNVLTKKIEGSMYPNWRGTDQRLAIISLTGDDLHYSAVAAKGGQVDSVWKRIN